MRESVYSNPVFGGSFPDPFVIRFLGEYWAYCTGIWRDGRAFGVLRSTDLVTWTEVGGAMEPLPDGPPHYWAPEVTYDNGRFLLYYSAGDEEHMHIRLAVADHPGGPFVDSGHRLTSEQFAIDAHVFTDDDGTRFMFYATDFLEHDRIGTGTVADRMLDAFTLEGLPRPITRARFDWQVYDPKREAKGGVKWHTVEGPFVLKRKGRYYQMFSGGNWQNVSYGVSYAMAPSLDIDGEWTQTCDDVRVVPVLRTIPGLVVGPGHNSVVTGPDLQQLYCVYHRWMDEGRAMCIDRQEWVGDRIAVLGPSSASVTAPVAPGLSGFDRGWAAGSGAWTLGADRALQDSTTDVAQISCDTGTATFRAEVGLRCAQPVPAQGALGLVLLSTGGPILFLTLRLAHRDVAFRWLAGGEWKAQNVPLAEDVDLTSWRLLRVDADGAFVRVTLDGGLAGLEGDLEGAVSQLQLVSEAVACEFGGFALARGWTNEFSREAGDPAAHGWTAHSGAWRVQEYELRSVEADAGPALKRALDGDYELVVDARVVDGDGSWIVGPAMTEDGRGPLVSLASVDGAWWLRVFDADATRSFALGEAFDPREHTHLRFRRLGALLEIDIEATRLGEVEVSRGPTSVALASRGARVAFDHVRVTEAPADDGRI